MLAFQDGTPGLHMAPVYHNAGISPILVTWMDLLLFKDYYYYYSKGRVRVHVCETGRQWERDSHVLVHSPNVCNGWGCSRPALGARSFIWLALWVQGHTYLVCLPLLCQAHPQGAGLGVEQLGLQRASMWDANKAGGTLTCHATMLAPCISF